MKLEGWGVYFPIHSWWSWASDADAGPNDVSHRHVGFLLVKARIHFIHPVKKVEGICWFFCLQFILNKIRTQSSRLRCILPKGKERGRQRGHTHSFLKLIFKVSPTSSLKKEGESKLGGSYRRRFSTCCRQKPWIQYSSHRLVDINHPWCSNIPVGFFFLLPFGGCFPAS